MNLEQRALKYELFRSSNLKRSPTLQGKMPTQLTPKIKNSM